METESAVIEGKKRVVLPSYLIGNIRVRKFESKLEASVNGEYQFKRHSKKPKQFF